MIRNSRLSPRESEIDEMKSLLSSLSPACVVWDLNTPNGPTLWCECEYSLFFNGLILGKTCNIESQYYSICNYTCRS